MQMRQRIEELKRKIQEAKDEQEKRRRRHLAAMNSLQLRLSAKQQEVQALRNSIQANEQTIQQLELDTKKYHPALFGEQRTLSVQALRDLVESLNSQVNNLALQIVQAFRHINPSPVKKSTTIFQDCKVLSDSVISNLEELHGAGQGYAEHIEIVLRAVIAWRCAQNAESWYISNQNLDRKFKQIQAALSTLEPPLRLYWESITHSQLHKMEASDAPPACEANIWEFILDTLAFCGWDAEAYFHQDAELKAAVNDRVREIAQVVVSLNQSLRQDRRAQVTIGWHAADSPVDHEVMQFGSTTGAVSNIKQVSCTIGLGLIVEILAKRKDRVIVKATVA
ncbi:hypothetical protein AX16_005060 [Volvariella volvacea WC 439]|nr:hypothetical protein AX16_005060 [Volvariella volvacea WC 439]